MAAMYTIMPKRVEETVMFKGDEDAFESLFDKVVSFASVQHSLRLGDNPARAGTKRDPIAIEVDALNKGRKSKSGNVKSVTC